MMHRLLLWDQMAQNFPPLWRILLLGGITIQGLTLSDSEFEGIHCSPQRGIATICCKHCFTQEIEEGAFRWSFISQRIKNVYWGEFLAVGEESSGVLSKLCGKGPEEAEEVWTTKGLHSEGVDMLKEWWKSDGFLKKSAKNKENR